MLKLNLYFKTILGQILIWTFAMILYSFFREFGQQTSNEVAQSLDFSLFQRLVLHLVIGIVSGILFGTYAYFMRKYLTRKIPFGHTIAISSIGYILTIIVFVLLSYLTLKYVFQLGFGKETIKHYVKSGQIWVLIVFCFLVGFFIEFFREIDRKFGPGNLLKMLSGKFYQPQEEERIIMFLDMRSSTTIAETLGHIKYSQLVQDCFKDLNVISDYKAEVYQYVGDEVVLSWASARGLENNNCVQAFFAYKKQLNHRKTYYINTYGLQPEFKAGANIGLLTVAEVGDIKREIAYHGDPINTAARIQSKCNAYQKDLLISEALAHRLPQHRYQLTPVGEVELRGKQQLVNIIAVE